MKEVPAGGCSRHARILSGSLAVLLAVLMVSGPVLLMIGNDPVNVSADSLTSWDHLLRMHEGSPVSSGDYDWLNTSVPQNPSNLDYDSDGLLGITIKKNLPSQRWRHFWVLSPPVNSDVSIQGDISAHIWAASRDNESGSMMTITLSDMAPSTFYSPSSWTVVGSATIALAGPIYSSWKAYDLNILGIDHVLATGHSLVLTIMRGDSINDGLMILYDNDVFDSYLIVPTRDFISVDEVWTEDESGASRNVFADTEEIVVYANVSNPFGAYDIHESYLEVTYSGNGTVCVPSTPLTLVSQDSSSNPSWKLLSTTLDHLCNGTFNLTVYGYDALGTPAWLTSSISVVTADHFEVIAPSSIIAGKEFEMTITALDSTGEIVPSWRGTVEIEPVFSETMTSSSGSLNVTTIEFDGAENGVFTVEDQSYDAGEEMIILIVSSNSRFGYSDEIRVWSGPVSTVSIDPAGPITSLPSGSTVSFTVVGLDSLGNENSSWSPSWSVFGSIGTISGSGMTISFIALNDGVGGINCSDPATGRYVNVNITVVAGSLVMIALSPSGLLSIPEGQSQALVATGYDSYSNIVNISGATWSTNTSGKIVGSGTTVTYTAGYIPESGVIEVMYGSISASINVTVTNALNGPRLSTIPAQIATEDSTWSLSLTSYWHHTNGTADLKWFAENVDTSLYLVTHDPSSEAIVKFYTQSDKFGSDTFRLWVRDPDGFSTYQDIVVSIQPVNDRPHFVHSPPTEIYVKFSTPYVIDYSYYVEDVDNAKGNLLMFAESSDYGDVLFDHLISTFLFLEKDGINSYFEIITITLTDADNVALSDSTNSDYLNVVIWVTDDTPPSLNDTLPDMELNEGDLNVYAFDLDDFFFDQDPEDYLVYQYGFENIVIFIDQETHKVYMSAPFEWSGVTEGTLTAMDPTGAFKTDTITVTVFTVNDPPSISPINDIHVRYDVTTKIDASMYVSDPDHTMEELTFSFDSPNATYSDGMIELLFPANLSGGAFTSPYIVKVGMTVADPEYASAMLNFSVVVSDNYPPAVAYPIPYPTLISFPEDTYLNNSLKLDLLFYDVDDTDLSYRVVYESAAPNIHVMIYPDGVVNFTAAVNWSGNEILGFVATDSHGAWASWMVTVSVTPVNDAPIILPIHDFVFKGWPRNSHYIICQFFIDSETPYSSLVISAIPDLHVSIVGNYLYVSLPDDVDIITVTLQATDGDGATSNKISFNVGVTKTMAEKIGWPYTFPLVLLAAGIASYFAAMRMPRPYSLENLFLIHNDGRLIAHITETENTNMDNDVVSAMFTAVQEFVRDSFQQGEVGLKKLEIGDKSVIIEKGKSVYIAMIYSGWPRKEVFTSLAMLLRDIEERYSDRIIRWNGTMKSLKGVQEMLQIYMSNEFKPGSWQAEEEIGEAEWVDILDKDS